MNKLALSSLIIASIVLSPTLRADSPASAPDTEMQSTPSAAPTSTAQETTPQENGEMATTPETPSTEDEGSTVSAEENTANKAAKKRQWFNIFLAVAAVVVAVTAMILVAHNDGHKA
jgi:hypothetical protein